MARATKGLTAKRVQALKVPGIYHDTQGPVRGLHLQVGDNGSKSWLLRFEIDKRERWMGLGSAADFSLKEARERARQARQLLSDGIDPIEHRLAQRDASRKQERENITFKQATKKFFEARGHLWRSAKHRHEWQRSLREYAFPLLGERPIKAIDAACINEALASAWTRVPNTAARVRERVHAVIRWVENGMPLPTIATRNGQNFAALSYAEIPSFMEELRERQGVDARALEFLILTAARTGEVLGLPWDEIDLDKRLWVLPAARAKTGNEHRVPLSSRAVAILESVPREDGNKFVFIGARAGGGLGHNALLNLVGKMRGPDVTVHGFRSAFRSWVDEVMHVEHAVAEAALAHVRGDKVEQAYRRGDMLVKRAKLMQAWADFCASKPATVLPLREAVR